ncbi:jhy protein homolog isoform X2 [Sebastes umbrosus]|uniref:jhy protein homolog isoform X2 n=1 Tax=Sebastes umbrosus TaxID=72105 RepID=UPI0018A0821B|nr:jhy protein homolog isoform X2 [Sebastes umbrosus]
MDKGLRREKMSQVLKTEHLSPRRAALDHRWDSVESDTESLAHERVYQQQLQMRIGRHDQNKPILPQKENADSLQQRDGEDEDATDEEIEDHQIYDSLDVAAHPHGKRKPILLKTDYLDVQMDDREGTSQLLTDDAYDDLRYDPNWRTNLRGAGSFIESPQVYYYQVPKEKSSPSYDDKQGLIIKGGYRYIVDTSPAVVVTPHVAGEESDQPYRLHSQEGQTSSITSRHCHSHALQLTSPEAESSSMFNENESDKSLKRSRKKRGDSCDSAGENISRSPELTGDIHAMYIQECKNDYLQELRRTQGGQMSTSTPPKVLVNKKLERPTEDIVERNKITLGRNACKCGSYASVHALKQETPHNVNKVTQIRDGKKAQRKEYPNPPEQEQQQQQPPALGVKAEWGDCLSSPFARPAAVAQPNPQKTTSSQALLPTIHLSINLNPSSHVLPLIQQRGQDDIIHLASPPGCPHWSPASEVQLRLSPGCQQTNSGKSSQTSQKGLDAHLHHQNLESSPERPERWQRSPTSTSSLGSGSYTVVPPIGKSLTGKEPEPSPGVNTDCPVQSSSSSDGYLAQMEKQKQLRANVTYKAYGLKDYKQLKPDTNLGGLGADYTATEKTAEKIKRQKLYSNVIREQNKKISRIPFLLAKDPEGDDKKVPRMKALEYAKTIAKLPVQSQPKQRQKHQSGVFTEHAPYLEGLDDLQLATLEVLRKRHEEEKQAVALFRKLHAV